MTLFTGLGYLFGIPLSTALGRRPVFLCAATITSIATFWAGAAGSFEELIVTLCFQALAVGTSVGMVSVSHLLRGYRV
jgi:MFS family permease